MAGHVGGAPVLEHELELPPKFWSLIAVPDDVRQDCWEWQGIRWKSGGYGRWNQHNWGYWVHRITYAQYRGPIPEVEGQPGVIDHLCMNKICCNPFHLDPTTSQDNIRRWAEQTIQTCAQGHPLTRDNVEGKKRRCKICHRDRQRARRERERLTGSLPRRRQGHPITNTTKLGYLINVSGLRKYEVSALCGIDVTILGDYINAKREIRLPHIQVLCDLFDVDPEDIIGYRTAPDASGDRAGDRGTDGGPGGGDGPLRGAPPEPGRVGGRLPDQVREGTPGTEGVTEPHHDRPERGPGSGVVRERTPGTQDRRGPAGRREVGDGVAVQPAVSRPDVAQVHSEADLEWMCQVKSPVCTGRAVYRHHRKMRSRGGSDDPVNLVSTCLACHDYIHANVTDATERGFLLHSWDEETPLDGYWT